MSTCLVAICPRAATGLAVMGAVAGEQPLVVPQVLQSCCLGRRTHRTKWTTKQVHPEQYRGQYGLHTDSHGPVIHASETLVVIASPLAVVLAVA